MALAFGAQDASGGLSEARPRICDHIDKRSWEERSRDPRAGVMLLPGLVSAMPRSQVAAINPLLVGRRPRGRIQLIPGFAGRAQAVFTEKTDLLRYLYQEGGDGHRALKAARAYFGDPQETRPLGSFIDSPLGIRGGTLYEKRDEYRWCDRDRLVVLNIRADLYRLTIQPR
jgi:hypothetical protein